jgi:hypothetical protein
MPDSVKISELVPRTALADDVLPAVDGTFTSTLRVTAASIAAIGGGPPGDGLVSTVKLAAKAVTYPKIQDVTANRILGRTATNGQIEEIPCSQLARDFLAAGAAGGVPGQTAMRAVISALAGMSNPPFTGQVRLQPGSQTAPSITMGDYVPDPDNLDLTTGLYFPELSAVGITTDGTLKWSVDGEGTQYANIAGSTTMRPQYSCRAWVAFNGNAFGSTTINNQATIAQRFGKTQSLYNDGFPNGATVAKIISDESNIRGNTISAIASAAADGRSNYSSPENNTHWAYNSGSGQWYTVRAETRQWIGSITFSATTAQTILKSGGISSVVSQGTGQYRVNFLTAMPDTSYAVVATGSVSNWSNSVGDHVASRQNSYFDVHHYENNALVNTAYLSVAVFR